MFGGMRGFLATRSTVSLPVMPLGLGAQMKVIFLLGGFRLSCMWIRWTRGCEELTFRIARRAASESEHQEVLRIARRVVDS